MESSLSVSIVWYLSIKHNKAYYFVNYINEITLSKYDNQFVVYPLWMGIMNIIVFVKAHIVDVNLVSAVKDIFLISILNYIPFYF